MQDELFEELLRAPQLTERHRTLLRAWFVDKMTETQIAMALGLPSTLDVRRNIVIAIVATQNCLPPSEFERLCELARKGQLPR